MGGGFSDLLISASPLTPALKVQIGLVCFYYTLGSHQGRLGPFKPSYLKVLGTFCVLSGGGVSSVRMLSGCASAYRANGTWESEDVIP